MNDNKLNRNDVEDILALSPTQQGILFHFLNDKDSRVYLEQTSVRIEGPVNRTFLKQAFDILVQNNEMLRTVFRFQGIETPVQVVLKKSSSEVSFENSNENDVAKIREKEYERQFDITKSCFKVRVCIFSENSFELIITNHHIIYDGWGNAVLINEFLDIYENLINGKKYFPPPKAKYKDFIKFSKNINESDQRKFWSSYLQGVDTRTILPKDYLNNSKLDNKILSVYLGKQLFCAIDEFSKSNNVTVSSVLCLAWGMLLQKYNNSSDVVFGTVVSGRNSGIYGVENTVGLFINTLPFRVKNSYKDHIIDIVKKINNDLKSIQEFSFVSASQIKSYCNQDMFNTPFDSILIIENYPISENHLSDEKTLKIRSYTAFEKTNFNMAVFVSLSSDDIKIDFNYNSNLFGLESVRRFQTFYINILKQIISHAENTLDEVSLLPFDETKMLLEGFNKTKLYYSLEENIISLFEKQVLNSPHNIAVEMGKESLSYFELNEKVNKFANYIKSCGIKNGDNVVLLLGRSIEMLIAILGVLKLGAAYIPVDPDYPVSRIMYIIDDCNPSSVIVDNTTVTKFPFEKNVININDPQIEENSRDDPGGIILRNDLAYIIYTSGTTGNPKGVMISHGALTNFILGTKQKIFFQNYSSILSLTTISFDIFVLENLLPLTVGLKVIIASVEQQKDPNALAKLISASKVDMLQMVPSRLQLLLMNPENVCCLKNVKVIMVGGEAFPDALFGMLKSNTSAKIYNMYGPTEATVWVSISDLTDKKIINAGKPIASTEFYVLDENKKLQPIGAVGELYIFGDSLSSGYFNNEKLTNEKFVLNPYKNDGSKMYRTGDLAVWNSDGEISILGRTDFQVKIRGFRVELNEIENVLLKHHLIKQAAVTVNKDDEQTLCAYYVSSSKIAVSEIRNFLLKRLPTYMIPSVYIHLDNIPETPNGKIDRKMLKKLYEKSEHQALSADTHNNMLSDIEKNILKIWQEVLHRENIGVNENFFSTGGNSINLVQMHYKIDSVYPGVFSVMDLFDYNTIFKISQQIESKIGCGKKSFASIKLNCPLQTVGTPSYLNSVVNKDVIDKLLYFSKREGVALKDILIGLYAFVLYQFSEFDTVSFYKIQNKLFSKISIDFSDIESNKELFKVVADEVECFGQIKKVNYELEAKDSNRVCALYCEEYLSKDELLSIKSLFDIRIFVSKTEGELNIDFSTSEKISHTLATDMFTKYVNLLNSL